MESKLSKPEMNKMKVPENLSLLDILHKSLSLIDRKTFVHRLIYFGEHSFGESSIPIEKAMKKAVDETNNLCWDEPLSGLLIYYPSYFVHLVDGSEKSINNHLLFLMRDYKKYLGGMKILLTFHHINQRFFDVWGARTAKPPTLLEKINPNADADETFRHIDRCITKIYSVAVKLRVWETEDEPKTIDSIRDDIISKLPEYSLLEFLLKSHYLQTVEDYVNVFLHIPTATYVDSYIWPVRMDFVPLDIFQVDLDPIQDLYPK